jgi:isochorismate synthase
MISVETKSAHTTLERFSYQEIWEASRNLGFPGALWRLPQSTEFRLLISIENGVSRCQPELEKLAAGFMLAPFTWQENDDVLFMTGDIIITFSEQGSVQDVINHLGEEHPSFKVLVEEAGREKIKGPAKGNLTRLSAIASQHDQGTRDRFERTVELAVAAIRSKQFHKVVLSRIKKLRYHESFSPAVGFSKLAASYPHAFISLVSLPEQQELWLGATPETLIRQTSEGAFRTMSLAGTQIAHDENGQLIPRYDIRWGQKEIEEQALVSRYIVECFKKIRLREYLETGPKTVLAGNLYHLRTNFEVDTDALAFPELGSVMLRLLHPTSAVCGVPKISSQQFIAEIEGYDRSFYSGFLGPVQIDGESNLFVNLRTVSLREGEATFYAGAGITEDSIPEREWEETEMKCDTLLKVLNKNF